MNEKKTSMEWLDKFNIKRTAIFEPTGWDGKNSFYYSFFKEKITLEQMRDRIDKSKINVQMFGGKGFFRGEKT